MKGEMDPGPATSRLQARTPVFCDKSEWGPCVRELRTEEGWAIFTHIRGRLGLIVGSYVPGEDRQDPEQGWRIPDDARVAVLERDDFACRHYGWTRDQLRTEVPRKLLELRHVTYHNHGVANTVETLVTLCNVHHDQVNAGKQIAPNPSRAD